MDELERAKALLRDLKYREAAAALDRLLLAEPKNDELWYLRGVISLKMRNYDAAVECFERALLLGPQSRYFQIKGMAHFELFEIEKAVEAFTEALRIEPDEPTTNFFLALCYLFLDDPRSDAHIRKARMLDGRKTRQLLLNFYSLFLKDDARISPEQRKKIEERLQRLK